MIYQVKAAAGSGKTFSLAKHFISLLQGPKQPLQGLQSILAITFTNKAAIEMKTRIITWLKKRALQDPDSPIPDFSQKQAASLLKTILHNYQALNIRTIDSILNQVLKSIALELGLPPDFKTTFTREDLLEPAYQSFLSQAEQGKKSKLLLDLLTTHLTLDNKPGFWLGGKIKDKIWSMAELLSQSEDTPPAFQNRQKLETRQQEIYQTICQETDRFQDYFLSQNIALKEKFRNALATLPLKLPPPKIPSSEYLKKNDLFPCVLKKSHDLLTTADHEYYLHFCQKIKTLQKKYLICHLARLQAPLIEVSQEILKELESAQRDKGLVWGNRIANLTCTAFNNYLFSESLFRLGASIKHLLIDEFQDTSRGQWKALRPLIVEALSQGGSLFYVGDIKQSIYGWRGAQPQLFDSLLEDQELQAIVPNCHRTQLDTNWRSAPEIVSFNNKFFKTLSRGKIIHQTLGNNFPPALIESFSRQIQRTFKDVEQKIAPDKPEQSGLISCYYVPGKKKDEFNAHLETRLIMLLQNDLLPRRKPGEIAILVRSNAEAELVSNWLMTRQIQVITENSLSLFAQPLVQEIMSILRFLNNPDDDLAFAAILLGEHVFQPFTQLKTETFASWLSRQQLLQGHWQESSPSKHPTPASNPLKPSDKGRGLWSRFALDFPLLWEQLLQPVLQQGKFLGPYELACLVLEFFKVQARYPQNEPVILRFLELIHLCEQNGITSLDQFLNLAPSLANEEKLPCPEHVPAIRISSIHKAKGLDFPVVITPFLNWKITTSNDFLAIKDNDQDYLLPARALLSPDYQEHVLKKLLEELNLLYVAWTRPREELHIFLPNEYKNPSQVRELIINTLQQNCFSIHKDWALGSKKNKEALVQQQRPVSSSNKEGPLLQDKPIAQITGHPPQEGKTYPSSPRLKVFHQLRQEKTDPAIERGTFIHRILELLAGTKLSKQDILKAWQRTALENPGLPCTLEEIMTIWQWISQQKQIKEYLMQGRAEQEFACQGKLFRIDLLYTDQDKIVALEYKTGNPEPGHSRQMRLYMHLLEQVFNKKMDKKVEGIIIYLDRQEIKNLDPS